MSIRLLSVAAVVGMLLAAGPSPAEAPVNERARLIQDFTDRATKYVELQKKVAATLPPLPEKAEPEQITAHQKALAKAIRASRTDAQQGAILFPGVVPFFLEVLRSDLAGAKGRDARETIKDGNPRVEKPHARPAEPKPKPVVARGERSLPRGGASFYRAPGSARQAAEASRAARVPFRRRPPDPP